MRQAENMGGGRSNLTRQLAQTICGATGSQDGRSGWIYLNTAGGWRTAAAVYLDGGQRRGCAS